MEVPCARNAAPEFESMKAAVKVIFPHPVIPRHGVQAPPAAGPPDHVPEESAAGHRPPSGAPPLEAASSEAPEDGGASASSEPANKRPRLERRWTQ